MEAQRKRAYRRLLYHALVDLRSHHGISPYGTFPWWNVMALIMSVRVLRQKVIVAEWLHNLAQFCADEALDEFDEGPIWKEFERFKEDLPTLWSYGYREQFEADLKDGPK
jgi:hypothetical protein